MDRELRELVTSVEKHAKFKALSIYSLQVRACAARAMRRLRANGRRAASSHADK